LGRFAAGGIEQKLARSAEALALRDCPRHVEEKAGHHFFPIHTFAAIRRCHPFRDSGPEFQDLCTPQVISRTSLSMYSPTETPSDCADSFNWVSTSRGNSIVMRLPDSR
jgi:hypothetical protein